MDNKISINTLNKNIDKAAKWQDLSDKIWELLFEIDTPESSYMNDDEMELLSKARLIAERVSDNYYRDAYNLAVKFVKQNTK